MKTLIVYKSNTGFTKEYVDMIKKRIVDATVVEIKKLNSKLIKQHDIIFYGGPLRNNVILGLNKFLKYNDKFGDKDIFIFATGIQPIDNEKKGLVIDTNHLDLYHVRLYLLPGGLDISKMSKFQQKMIKFGLKMAEKSGKMPGGVDSSMIESRLNTPLNLVSPLSIERMMEVYTLVNLKRMKNETKWCTRIIFYNVLGQFKK